MRVIETKVYEFSEHPNKELCFDWIRNNWHDLNEHSIDEIVDSIKALRDKIGGTIDWQICLIPDRGEYIKFTDFDEKELEKLNADDFPLTGVCWDYSLIKSLKDGNPDQVLDDLHSETDYVYSDEGLYELCSANCYEFNEFGEFV